MLQTTHLPRKFTKFSSKFMDDFKINFLAQGVIKLTWQGVRMYFSHKTDTLKHLLAIL